MNGNIHDITIEEKIGNIFMPLYSNNYIDGDIVNLITTYHISGVVLSNVQKTTEHQLAKLTTNLQYYAGKSSPLLIASDPFQEEDLHKKSKLIPLPNQETLLQLNNRLYTRQLADVVSAQCRLLNINMLLEPTIQVPKSNRHKHVQMAKQIEATIKGIKQNNVLSAVSGFPRPEEIDVDLKYNQQTSNLYPFYKAVESGVDVIKINDVFDPTLIEWIRHTLSFDGIILYELSRKKHSIKERSEQVIAALHSGVDLFILQEPYDAQIELINYIIELAQENNIDQTALNTAVRRIRRIKKKYKLDELSTFEKDRLQTHFSKQLMEKINDLQEKT